MDPYTYGACRSFSNNKAINLYTYNIHIKHHCFTLKAITIGVTCNLLNFEKKKT